MQTDAGFIENVENASQTGADLCREPYPLRCAAGNLACLAYHKCSNAIPRELALGLLIKPLHLRHESLERFCDFLFTVAAKLHFNRLTIRAEVKRGFECFRQIGKRQLFVHVEVFNQRILQMPIKWPKSSALLVIFCKAFVYSYNFSRPLSTP